MHLGRHLTPWIVAALGAAQTIAAHSEPASLWDHNDSLVGLYTDGATRVFRYQNPRIDMQQEGVVPGTLLFQGSKSGDTYSGTAYVFSRRCGAHPYHVSGSAAFDERQITLYGTAPAGFDGACRPVVYRQDVLQFSFLKSTAPPPLVYGSAAREAADPQESQDRERARAEARTEQERTDRIRGEREREERRLAELRTFSSQREACRKYDVAACDDALASPHANAQDANDLRAWREAAAEFTAVLKGCQDGSLEACDAALASPAVTPDRRPLIETWRMAASPLNRARTFVSLQTAAITTAASDVSTTVRNLPTSTHIAAAIAMAFALALAAMAWRIRHGLAPAVAKPDRDSRAPQRAATDTTPPANTGERDAGWAQRLSGALASPFAAVPSETTELPKKPEPQSPPPLARDTPAAIAAMELAHAYIEEVRHADTPALEDEQTRKHHLNTLSLASKQLDRAERLDPDAIFEGEDKDVPYRFSINELKAEALFLEGLTHQTYDIKRAIPSLMRATALNPNDPRAFYVLGLTHAANRNKAEAVAALQRAVALDPKNLSYRKELNRTENLSATEIAAYKATRAAERIYDAGIQTANAGIMAWNIFAILWNIVTFPLRALFAIFRFLRLYPFA